MAYAVQSINYDLEQNRVNLSVMDGAAEGGWKSISATFIMKTPNVDPKPEVETLAIDNAITAFQEAIDFLKSRPTLKKSV